MSVPVIGFGRRLERPTPPISPPPSLPVVDAAGARDAYAANGGLTAEDQREFEASIATLWGSGEMARRDREEASWDDGPRGAMLVFVFLLVAISGAAIGIAGWLIWTLVRTGRF